MNELQKIERQIESLESDVGFINRFDPRIITDWVLSKPELVEEFLQDYAQEREQRIAQLKERRRDSISEEL